MLRAVLVAVLLLSSAAHAGLWTDDYAQAVKRAQVEKKFLFLDFTGSDWCGWCKKLDKEVFSQKEFKAYAEANLVCVKLDFPQSFNLPGKTVKQNRELAQRHQVTGYPTIVVLSPNEELVDRSGYLPGGVDTYLKQLERVLVPARAKLGAAPSAPSTALAPETAPATALAPVGEYRTWTSRQGATIEARLEKRVGNTVHLRTADDKTLTIQIGELSAPDQAFIYAPPKAK